MSTLAQLRKLIFGETWVLPLGVCASVAIAAAVRELAGPHGWWHRGGGFVLLALLAVTLTLSLAGALRAHGK